MSHYTSAYIHYVHIPQRMKALRQKWIDEHPEPNLTQETQEEEYNRVLNQLRSTIPYRAERYFRLRHKENKELLKKAYPIGLNDYLDIIN